MTFTGTIDGTQVRVAGNGAIYKAPVGSTAPTDEVAAWGAAWINLGFATDGFTLTPDLKVQEITAWQTLDIVRVIRQQLLRSVQFELLQSNVETVKMAWGGLVITPGTSPKYGAVPTAPGVSTEFALGMDWVDGALLQRIIIPRADLLKLSPVKYGRGDVVRYNFDARILPPASGPSVQIWGADLATSGA